VGSTDLSLCTSRDEKNVVFTEGRKSHAMAPVVNDLLVKFVSVVNAIADTAVISGR
jgi:hypothetical protein